MSDCQNIEESLTRESVNSVRSESDEELPPDYGDLFDENDTPPVYADINSTYDSVASIGNPNIRHTDVSPIEIQTNPTKNVSERCIYTPEIGRNNGIKCTENVLENTHYCSTHICHIDSASKYRPCEFSTQQTTVNPSPASPTIKKKVDQETDNIPCPYIPSRGIKKGIRCNYRVLSNTDYCALHIWHKASLNSPKTKEWARIYKPDKFAQKWPGEV